MNSLLVMISLLSALALTGAAASVFALQRAHRLVLEAGRRREPAPADRDPELQSLRDSIQALAAQVQELRNTTPVAMAPGTPRPGLNLSKRSQALRMHRRGESIEQIATSLAVPRQEVNLLVKVHRIVLGTIEPRP